MATTSPDSIFSPSGVQQWNLTSDWRQTAESVQTALNEVRDEISPGAHAFSGTSAERLAFSSEAKEGDSWQDTNSGRGRYVFWAGTWEDANSQRVLWSHPTGWYLNGLPDNTINLSEPVSAQKNGIIVVWQRYESGAPVNGNYNYIYVPKAHVNGVVSSGGSGMNHILMDGNDIVRKYVYVSDTTIEGLSSNQTAPNNKQVTRWVLGY